MDQAIRFLIRQYATQPSAENAIALANAVLRSQGAFGESIPHKHQGFLTYAGLLTQLLGLNHDALASTATFFDDNHGEYEAITGLVHTPDYSDVLDPNHPIFISHLCMRCSAPLGDAEASAHLQDPENINHSLCQNCIYCVECANPEHDSCPLIAGCPCCDDTMQNNI